MLQGYDDGQGNCVLEIAAEGTHTLDQVGSLDGITRERARQIEAKAFANWRRAANEDGELEA